MATIDDLKKEVDTLKKEFNKYEVSSNPDGSYTVGGKRLSAKEFGAIKKVAKTNYDRVNNKYKSLKEKETTKVKVSQQNVSELNKELQKLQTENTRRAANIVAQKGEGRFAGSQDVINKNNARIKEITKTLTSLGKSPIVQQAKETSVPASAAQFRQKEGFAPGKKKTTTKTKVPVKPGAAVAPETTVSPKETVKKTVNWEPKFREMFPKQSWLLDLDRTKYPQLFKLLQDGVDNEMWLTTESQERFAAQLSNTDFYVELKTNDTVKNIKSMVGDLGFDTIPFNSFLKNVMNYGWKDDTLKKEVYKEAFRKDPATGNYVNSTTIERVRKSAPYLNVSLIGKQFFNTVSDDTVGKVLAGEMLPDDVTRQQRELAKGKYGHLSGLIDQGLSLVDIADSYKTSASRLLEKDPNSIDMSQGAYSTAFDFGEEGKKRLMTTSEWEVKLRSDATFGWDKTQNAREEARSLANTIAQAFGRVI